MGLKRDLVRVLGNMCYEDPPSQNAVRQEGAMPLILCVCVRKYRCAMRCAMRTPPSQNAVREERAMPLILA
jgi:hypothetical protein